MIFYKSNNTFVVISRSKILTNIFSRLRWQNSTMILLISE